MRRRVAPLLIVTGLAAWAALFSPHEPLLVWNASASAPLGLYALTNAVTLRRGDLVLADLPRNFARFANTRGYLPMGVPLVKRIAARAGDTICSIGRSITINGQLVALRLAVDADGRALPIWPGCHRLQQDDVFLLMRNVPDSFDGRYFGPVRRTSILGKLTPLWTY